MKSSPRERAIDRAAAAALAAALLALFWLGRSRSFGPGDSAEHVVSALLWGVPHAPGYPLQTALGWAWSRLPWSNPRAAVNGLSGVFHAAAAAILFLLLRRSGVRRTAALTATAFMALAPLFWYYSLVAEVRALNDLLALGAAYFAIRWRTEGDARSLIALALVFGLGVSHHPTFVLISPALAVWISARRPSPRLAAVSAVVAAVALAVPYLLLGARLAHGVPAYDLFGVRGWNDLLPLFLRRDVGGPVRMVSGDGFLEFGRFDARALLEHAGWLAASFWTHAGPVALVLAAIGAVSSWRRDRREFAAWALWGSLSAGVFVVISSQQIAICDREYARAVLARFDLLPMIALFALAGHGAEALARLVRPLLIAALAVAAFAAPVVLRPLSLRGQDPLLDYARGLVRDSGPNDFVVLTSDDSIFAVQDLDFVRGETGGRVFLEPSLFSYFPYIRRLQARFPDLRLPFEQDGLSSDWARWRELNRGRAVLIESSVRDGVLDRYPHSVPQGTLMRVETRPVKDDPAADARRFLAAPEIDRLTRASVRPWTQEVYVLETRRRQAEWIGSRLDSKRDRDLILAFKRLLAVL